MPVTLSSTTPVNVSWSYTPVARLVVSGITPVDHLVDACGATSITVTAQDANGNRASATAGPCA